MSVAPFKFLLNLFRIKSASSSLLLFYVPFLSSIRFICYSFLCDLSLDPAHVPTFAVLFIYSLLYFLCFCSFFYLSVFFPFLFYPKTWTRPMTASSCSWPKCDCRLNWGGRWQMWCSEFFPPISAQTVGSPYASREAHPVPLWRCVVELQANCGSEISTARYVEQPRQKHRCADACARIRLSQWEAGFDVGYAMQPNRFIYAGCCYRRWGREGR